MHPGPTGQPQDQPDQSSWCTRPAVTYPHPVQLAAVPTPLDVLDLDIAAGRILQAVHRQLQRALRLQSGGQDQQQVEGRQVFRRREHGVVQLAVPALPRLRSHAGLAGAVGHQLPDSQRTMAVQVPQHVLPEPPPADQRILPRGHQGISLDRQPPYRVTDVAAACLSQGLRDLRRIGIHSLVERWAGPTPDEHQRS